MAQNIEFFDGTEAQILALTSASLNWIERAFYYPSDKDYFYQVLNGRMRPFGKAGSEGANAGVGCKINGQIVGGVKITITATEVLDVPKDYDYNTYTLSVTGRADVHGQINIMR